MDTTRQETDVQRIEAQLKDVGDLALDIRDRASKLHDPGMDNPKPESPDLPVLVGGMFIRSLANIKDELERAKEALQGFN